jgi:CheY-like chemotaxis protein
MHQVLLNLCVNARDAMPQSGVLSVSLLNRHLDPEDAAAISGARSGDWLTIEVTDSGTGIPQDVLPLIWDSFYTTKPEGKGTGLGLPTVRNIVKEHGGFIQVETAVGRGSTFRVFLPANREDKARPDSESPFPQSPGREEYILVVDDDVSVREIVSAVLSQGGYRVLECADGVEAIVNYNAKSRDIALVITDVDMPNLGGAILAATLLRLNPGLRIIAMSGHTSSAVNRDQVDEVKGVAAAFLQKPFTAAELLGVVDRVLHPDTQP